MNDVENVALCSSSPTAFICGNEISKLFDCVVVNSEDTLLLEADHDRITVLLDEYQEQPHLLDSHLAGIVERLLGCIKAPETPNAAIHQYCKYLYLFTKVRGYKQALRYFSHEVADLEVVIRLLDNQNIMDHQTWETRYVLLLWLSIVCLIPFDLVKLDGGATKEQSIISRIYETVMPYLKVSDKCKDAAGYVISKFVTRPDVKVTKLPVFLIYAQTTLEDPEKKPGHAQQIAALNTLALIFKYGRRDDLLPYSSDVFRTLEGNCLLEDNNTLTRKYIIKLVQRIGLVFLAPKVLSWRYQRGNRSLANNLKKVQEDSIPIEAKLPSNEEEDEDFDIPEDLESIIEMLMTGLKDKDTIVRWCAAKGIGRITGRLPRQLADEVVESLFELFTFEELNSAWHGGCLVLAELGRRGLLLPERLPEVVPIILRALLYDERRGSYSVGAHVRDAACYICWSFARAYEPKQMSKHVVDIAASLLIVTVFDREVNCRRAASAAFQENVGRQGTFPHGIDIVTRADYFAVGNRTNCYCNLSVYLASFPEYTQQLIDHLLNVKIRHWDHEIRQLSSLALFHLTPTAPEYMHEKVLAQLVSSTSSLDVCMKHGAILALSEVVFALHLHYKKRNVVYRVNEDLLVNICKIVTQLRKLNKFKGYDGEHLRKAVCRMVETFALSNVIINDTPVLDDWLFVIEDSLSNTELPVQEAACRSLTPFCERYFGINSHFNPDEVIDRFTSRAKSSNKFTRMGYTLAAGHLPNFLLLKDINKIMDTLLFTCETDDNKLNNGIFAEARMNSISSLVRICTTCGLSAVGNTARIFDCFFNAMNDYTIDSRGDVGAWVRESAMIGLVDLSQLVFRANADMLSEKNAYGVVCNLVKQCAERIDRTRHHAGQQLTRLLHHSDGNLCIPDEKEIYKLLPKSLCESVNWAAPGEAYPTITKLLRLESYQYPVLSGLTVSVGGLTESLVRYSSDGLIDYFTDVQEDWEKMELLTNNLLKMLSSKQPARVVIPFLRLLDILLTSGCLDIYNDGEKSDAFPLRLFELLRTEMKGCADTVKLLASVKVYSGLLQFPGSVRKKSLQTLCMYLCHKYPRMREATAEQFYTALLTFDDVVNDENRNDVMNLLTGSIWADGINDVRVIRNKLCHLLNVPVPILKKPTAATVPQCNATVDHLDSYKDLVNRVTR